MLRSCSVAIILVWGLGLGCGSVKPLGRAQPPAELASDSADGALDSQPLGPDEALEDPAWLASEDPLYAVTTRVTTTSDATHSFLLTVPSIGPDTRFDLEHAVELDADTPAFGTQGRPFAYAASASAPTITRWRVQEDGVFEQGPLVSFESLGMRRVDSAGSLSFFAKDKAYFCNRFDPSQIVIWNPETMSIRGAIPLTLPLTGEMRPQVVLSQRSDRIFAVVSWQQPHAYDWTRFGDHVQVISVDPTTDGVVGRVDEARCNLLSWVSAASDGAAYFSPASYYAPLRSMLGEASGVEPCTLRISPDADSFDAGYSVDLASITSGRPAGDLFVVSDTTAFLRVWHAELVTPLSDGNQNWESVVQEAGFLWWTWQMGAEQAERVTAQRPSKDAQTFVVDGKTYTSTLSEDGASSVLEELDPRGELRPGLRGPGQIIGVFRLR
ncbi:MAG: hypothetical protein ABI895_19460 [Deltaproteobacteria bacterium]